MGNFKVKEWNAERVIYYWSDAPDEIYQIRGEWWKEIKSAIEEEYGKLTKEILEREIINIFVGIGKALEEEIKKEEEWANKIYI